MGGSAALVLVIDDDSGLRTLSRIVLELEGFSVREAGSLSEANAVLSEVRPEIVLLDVHLGNEQSGELFTRLRREGIPVAAVTGTADPTEFRDLADAVVSKPFEPDDLVAVAKRLASIPNGSRKS
jgi:DNA-binding response OmpR family regulator